SAKLADERIETGRVRKLAALDRRKRRGRERNEQESHREALYEARPKNVPVADVLIPIAHQPRRDPEHGEPYRDHPAWIDLVVEASGDGHRERRRCSARQERETGLPGVEPEHVLKIERQDQV